MKQGEKMSVLSKACDMQSVKIHWMAPLLVSAGLLLAGDGLQAEPAGASVRTLDSLEQDFRQPPVDAKNWTFWMWLRTPTTPEAMTRDLEEMKAKGIAGFILYDCGTPKDVPIPLLEPWTPEWRKNIRHVARESKRLGLKFCLAVGMSGCTAPGLDPQYSDQELKWTLQEVTGPMKFEGVLPLPDKSNASNKDGSPMFWDIRVLAVPVGIQAQFTDVLDISSRMDKAGKLSWEVPDGKWKIFRFIQRPINKVEGWGTKHATYCDLLSKDGIEQVWAIKMAPLLKELTSEERSAIVALEDDSYEGGRGNWTRTLPEEFKKRRGYDILKYLTVFAGEPIGDPLTRARVLRDHQQTIVDMVADNYFARHKELCDQNGFELYCEASNYPWYGHNGPQWFGDKVDINMGEFWLPFGGKTKTSECYESRGAAMANHIFGKKITMSESFTVVGSLWEETPFSLKASVDRSYCDGMNRVAFHNYSHSPLLDEKPGYVYYAGTHINRNITWWEQAPAFFKYLERCQAMLQQGNFVADALWLAGDGLAGGWETKINGQVLEKLGSGYDYDRISDNNLIELVSIKDGQLVTPGGMRYRILMMPHTQRLTLKLVQKIERLVEAGATIVGPRPERISGLPLHADEEKRFNEVVAKLWGNPQQPQAERKVGLGQVIPAKTPKQVLAEKGFGSDFEYTGLSEKGEMAWIHRQSKDADWYFVSSLKASPEKLTCTFRITGKQPELWDPVTGEMRNAIAFQQINGETIVPLEFDPCGSVFVVFRKSIDAKAAGTATGNFPVVKPVCQLDGAWTVAFDPKWGGPAEPVTFDSLVDWTTRPEEGIKYYSGHALYTKTFDMLGAVPAGQRMVLDLGKVNEIASVKLNGKDLGVIWMNPARVEVTGALKPSGNLLEINVVNLWPNRLIGDASLPQEKKFTKTNQRRFTKTSPLMPSGLLGPVTLNLLQDDL
jgi:hypothetical protein